MAGWVSSRDLLDGALEQFPIYGPVVEYAHHPYGAGNRLAEVESVPIDHARMSLAVLAKSTTHHGYVVVVATPEHLFEKNHQKIERLLEGFCALYD